MFYCFKRSAHLIFLAFTATLLASCGGGSDASSSSSAASTSTSGLSIFAEPSGPLCAVKELGICVEPTSSSTTLSDLLTALTDPTGPRIRLDRYGIARRTHVKLESDEDEVVVTEGSVSRDSLEKPIVFGQNQIEMNGKTYIYTKEESGVLFFYATPNDRIMLPLDVQPGVTFTQDATSDSVQSAPGYLAQTVDAEGWYSTFGLRTDKSDVSLPSNNILRYVGSVRFFGGNGAPFAGTAYQDWIVGGFCPITLELNASFGTLITEEVTCTSATGQTLHFSLGQLNVSDSRITSLLENEAFATATGTVYGGESIPGAPTTTVHFTSSKLGGAIYGTNAQYLILQGSGALGEFNIAAFRQ